MQRPLEYAAEPSDSGPHGHLSSSTELPSCSAACCSFEQKVAASAPAWISLKILCDGRQQDFLAGAVFSVAPGREEQQDPPFNLELLVVASSWPPLDSDFPLQQQVPDSFFFNEH